MPNKSKQIKFKNLSKPKTVTTTTVTKSKPQNKSEISMGRALLRALGGIGGGAAGLLTGSPTAGASYGYNLGNSAATILGLGSYSVKSNSLYNSTMRTGEIPNMHTSGQSVVVRHKEYIADIISSPSANGFVSTSYPINPGMSSTFPWLAGIASQYQEYTMKGLVFEYKSASADAIASSTNTALGTVIMTTRYNPLLPAPLGKLDALNEYFSSDAKPSQDFCHFIECDPKENPFNVLYVRDSAVSGNIQNYDLGELFVCVQGVQGASNVCGELWATYEVELRKPIITDSSTSLAYSQFSSYATTGISTSNYFGTSQVASVQGFAGCSIQLTNNQVVITGNYQGAFLVLYQVIGASSTGWQPIVMAPSNNCISLTPFGNGTQNLLGAPSASGGATTRIFDCYAFSYSPGAATPGTIAVTFSSGVLVSPTSMDILVIPFNPNAV